MEIIVLVKRFIFSEFKGEEQKVINRIAEYILQLHARNGSGFDTWIILNNLPCDRHLADIIKNGKSIFSMKVFIGYTDKSKKQLSQYLHFRCCMTLSNYSMTKLGKFLNYKKKY